MKINNLLKFSQEFSLVPKDKLLLWNIRINLILLFLQILILSFFYKFIPPQIPLFFSRPWGNDQLADKKFLFLIPTLLFIIFIVNLFLAALFYPKEKLMAKIIIFTTTLIFILLSITFLEILFLTTF